MKIENLDKAKLFIVCGLPASGKTTFTKEIVEKYGAIHLSEDEWIADLINAYDNDEMRNNIAKLHRKIAARLLEKGVNVVMDGGYYTKEERGDLRNIARNSGANFELHYLKTNVATLNLRRIERNKSLESKFWTTEENLKRAINSFQEPSDNENYILHES